MRIGLVFGGNTTEGEISKESATCIRGALQKLGYNFVDIEFDRNIAIHLMDASVDVVFNAMHGQYGEDGRLQGLLDIMKIPYTHSGCLSSAMTMNKVVCKKIFNYLGIKTAKSIVVKKQDLFDGLWKIKLADDDYLRNSKEVFVKPIADGSSKDTFLIKNIDEFNFNSVEIYTANTEFLIEEPIKGKEIQVAVFGKDPVVIGMLEVKPRGEFFDYQSKYTEGGATHLPVDLDKKVQDTLSKYTLMMHKALCLKDISRSEFIVTDDNSIYALEVNSHPGLTSKSIFPDIAHNAGILYEDIIDALIKNASYSN